ncbi:hypothetical protein ACI6QG_17110 [Roseococcus sp. DSY-14]|uniref:hypothetical protein n=1 Tax=Roseococcus sp. DSY-14 TaxID=3369650 RepID=UPI00387B0611
MSLALAEILPLHRPRLSFALLPEKHRLEVVFSGEVAGADYRALMLRALEAHPEAATMDWLYDLRSYSGSVGHDDVTVVAARARALAAGREERALSVLVTPDIGMIHWAAACRVQFHPRRVAVVARMEEAEALLACPLE